MMAFIGLATRFTNATHTIQQYQAVKDKILEYGLNIIRLGSGDELFSSSYTWHNGDAVQWFLDNTDCVVVVDRDHTIQLTSLSSSQQNIIDAHLEEMTIRWRGYGDRLWLEPVNEYGGSDFYTQMQRFLDVFRSKGYMNWLVFNKQSQPWSTCNLNDALNKIYIGYHYYFNSWSYENAVNDLNNGAALGKPIFGSEEGASWKETSDFTSENVGRLNRYLQYCADAGYSNVVWMNHELNNMTRYEELGLVFPKVEPQPPPPPPPSSVLPLIIIGGMFFLLSRDKEVKKR